MEKNYICPICGAKVIDIEAHMLQAHPEEVARQEKEMLHEMARQQREAMHEMRRMQPGIYEELLKELEKEESREIKKICAKEYLSMNEVEKAAKIFMEIVDDGDAEVYNGLGICYRRMGKYEEALKFFKKAIEYGEIETAVANICDIYEQQQAFVEEEEFLSKLIKQHENGYLYALYARILTMVGKYKFAEEIARKAIEMKEGDGYIYLAFSLILQKREEEAEEILKEFNEKYPDRMHSYILLANIYMEKDVEKAEKYLDMLHERASEPEILDYLIKSFLSIGKMEKAEEVIKEAIKMHNMPQYHLLYGIILLMKGGNEEKEFEAFLESFPSKDSYVKIIEIYLDGEKTDKAWKYLKKAEILYGSDEMLKCMRGHILFEEGNIDEAMEAYEASNSIKENIDAHVGIIKCCMKTGKIDAAIKACRKALNVTEDEGLKKDLEDLIKQLEG